MISDRDDNNTINIFGIFMIKMQSKESKIKTATEIAYCWEINMMEDRPGAIGFTSGFSQDSNFYGG